jgi:hypothetical protein
MAKANDRLRRFDAYLKAVVAPVLTEQGFVKAGRQRLWTRPSPTGTGIAQLVWVQVGEAASPRDGKFTVEFGIYYPKYDRFVNGRDQLGPVIGACHFDVRARLGVLMAPPEDRWWRYAVDEAALAEQLGQIARWLVDLGLPWLTTTDTKENASLYNTGKVPEPDRKQREAYERWQQEKRSRG